MHDKTDETGEAITEFIVAEVEEMARLLQQKRGIAISYANIISLQLLPDEEAEGVLTLAEVTHEKTGRPINDILDALLEDEEDGAMNT